jgi:predicted nucleic acid-binding protein
MLRACDEPRVVPSPVLVEIDYFVPGQAFARFLEDVQRGAFRFEELRPPDYARAQELLAEYSDLGVGFVDVAVLAVVERLRESRLATLDRRHFTVMRPSHVDALTLLPEG